MPGDHSYTSVGYGAGLEGVTALLAMHASCASGISVVGIDNGFRQLLLLRYLKQADRWCMVSMLGRCCRRHDDGLVDAGADQFAIIDAISSLGIDGWAITFEDVQRCGVRAKWSNIVIHEHDTPHHHGPAQQILDLIGSSGIVPATVQ